MSQFDRNSDDENIQALNFKLLFTLRGHINAISSVKFSPLGDYLASSSYDKVINIWDVTSGTLETSLSGHRKGISEIDWSKDGKLLVSASDDKRLKVWNVRTGNCERRLKGHTSVVFCTSFSSWTSNLIASGSDDRSVKLWDVETGRCLNTISEHIDRIVSVDFHPHACQMLSASHDGFCYIYDVTSQQRIFSLPCAERDEVLSFAKYSPNGNYVLTASLNNKIKLWNISKQKRVKTYKGHKNANYCSYADFLGGKYIVSGSEDRLIYIWDLDSSQLLQKLKGHEDVVLCIDCHSAQNLIASGGLEGDRIVRVWKS